MAVTMTVNGVSKNILNGTLDIAHSIDGRSSLRCAMYFPTAGTRPDFGQTVIASEDASEIFWGVIDDIDEEAHADSTFFTDLTITIQAVDYRTFCERVYVTTSLPEGTLKSMLIALSTWVGDTPYNVFVHPSQADGPTIAAQTYNFRKLSDILDELGTLSGGYLWSIDSSKRLRMELPSFAAVTAPFAVSDAVDTTSGKVKVKRKKTGYANRVWVRAGANSNKEVVRTQSVVTPAGTLVGSYKEYSLAYPSISYADIPKSVLVNGVAKTIGAPGTTNAGTAWEWIWQWTTTGPVETMVPKLRHNDAVYGATPGGVTLTLNADGHDYYNIVHDGWMGNQYYTTSGGYNWFNGAAIAARKPKPIPHTVYKNGVPAPIGIFGTTNAETGAPWDWVINGNDLGYRTAAGALSASDTITIHTRAPFEILVKSPLTSAEPTAAQTTYGLHEVIYDAPDITNGADAQALADALAIKLQVLAKTVRYPTRTPGIAPGQIQTITIANHDVSGNFLITETRAHFDSENNLERDVTAIDSLYYNGSWKDLFRKWSASLKLGGGGSSSGSTIAGAGGTGSASKNVVYFLGGSGVDYAQSATPTWVAASPIQALIDTAEKGTLNGIVTVRLRAFSGSVTARLQNVTDNVTVGTSVVVTSAAWSMTTFAVLLTAGAKAYELQLLPTVADTDVAAVGYLELV